MFHHCLTEKDVRLLWKRLLLRLHPDHGGTDDLVILLNESKESALQSLSFSPESKVTPRFEEKAEQPVWNFDLEEFVELSDFLEERAEKMYPSESKIVRSILDFFDVRKKVSEKQMDVLRRVAERLKETQQAD